MGEKALKKENQKLRAEVQKLLDELKNLQESFNSISNGGQASNTGQVNNAESEASASIQFLSDEYDDFRQFKKQAQQKLKSLSSRIAEISTKCPNFHRHRCDSAVQLSI